MKKTRSFLLAAGVMLALAFTFSCSSDDSDGGGNEAAPGPITKAKINGVSQKGPFIEGATIALYELNDALAQTGKSFKDRILDGKGSFEIRSVELASPYAMLEVNGNYRNEVTGESSSKITLFAISDIREKDKVNVNILTHLEYYRVLDLAEQGKSVKDAKKQAQREILEVFYINGEFENSEDMSIFGTSEGDAALLAISVLLQGDLTESELTQRLINFSQAIRIGNVASNTEAMKTAIADWASEADLEGIRSNIFSWQVPSVPPFEKYARNFVNTNYGLGPCDASNEGVIKKNSNEASRNKNMVCSYGIWEVYAGTTVSSSSSDVETSSSSATPTFQIKELELTALHFNPNASSSFADLDAGVVFRQSEALINPNSGKIDIVCEDHRRILSAFGAAEQYNFFKPLEDSQSFIVPLEGMGVDGMVKNIILSNNADANMLDFLKRIIRDRIEHIAPHEKNLLNMNSDITIFAVVSSEGDTFIAEANRIQCQEAPECIKLTYFGMMLHGL